MIFQILVFRKRIDYTPFGAPLGTWSLSAGYTGKPYDWNTRLNNYGFRDYAPHTGRFTTVDPIRDGINWYVYCNNDPVNWVDLWGLSASVIQQTLVGIGSAGIFTPEPVTTIIGVVVITVVLVDQTTGGVITDGISNLIDNIKKITQSEKNKNKPKPDNKKPGKGNKIPPGNQSPGPLGKGASGGAEKIPDPSKLGEPGNIPPGNNSVAVITATILAGLAGVYDNVKSPEADIPVMPEEKVENIPSRKKEAK